MAERVLFPDWRRANENTPYPFAERAQLTTVDGRLLLDGTFLDAVLYPIGGGAGLYLSKVVITHEAVTAFVGTAARPELCSGRFALVTPPDSVYLTDAYGRPAGLLVSESNRLGVFQSWGTGTHEFESDQTPFCASVCVPAPEVGVRGILLDDGSILTGDVWLVGSDGVVLRAGDEVLPGGCRLDPRTVRTIRVDVVGDPLFRRRLCVPADLFAAPRFIKTVRVIGDNQTFECSPDAIGDLKLTVANSRAADTVLRISATPEGVKIGAVGESIQ